MTDAPQKKKEIKSLYGFIGKKSLKDALDGLRDKNDRFID